MNPILEGLERLRENGWRHDTGTCMYLSIRGLATEELAILDEVCLEQFPDRVPAFMDYDDPHPVFYVNDDPATTFSDIERIMEKAAIRFEELVEK